MIYYTVIVVIIIILRTLTAEGRAYKLVEVKYTFFQAVNFPLKQMRNCKHVPTSETRVRLNEDIDPGGRTELTYRISDSFLFFIYRL